MHKIDISGVDLNLLAVSEVLLDERHVGRTAERLRLSQSATSHALGRLRRLFDDPLFVRHAAGIEPTHRARELGDGLAEALAQVRRLVSPVQFDPATRGRTFTIAPHEYAVAILMTKLLALLRQEAEGVDVRCVGLAYRDLITAFDHGDVDLACGAFPGLDTKRIERTPLFEDRFVGVVRAGHPALAEGRMSIAAFTSLGHAWVSVGSEPYDPVAVALAAQGRKRRIMMTVPNVLSVPLIVAQSDLVGVIPERLASSMSRPLQLNVFELPVTIDSMTCDLLMPIASAATPEARWLKGVFAKVASDAITPRL